MPLFHLIWLLIFDIFHCLTLRHLRLLPLHFRCLFWLRLFFRIFVIDISRHYYYRFFDIISFRYWHWLLSRHIFIITYSHFIFIFFDAAIIFIISINIFASSHYLSFDYFLHFYFLHFFHFLPSLLIIFLLLSFSWCCWYIIDMPMPPRFDAAAIRRLSLLRRYCLLFHDDMIILIFYVIIWLRCCLFFDSFSSSLLISLSSSSFSFFYSAITSEQ